ncbi:hypothetical protein BpHYR1_032020 [Brachionus plicatilis]|uniref:Uncharacterized protein n=1 Tax=Brachionus plicatilis TaxID=10195 RepID=A0A3M7T1J1_BRAPC|nr:hypothetical protein BpHYR1_032020 [Brachionus plicatilis]
MENENQTEQQNTKEVNAETSGEQVKSESVENQEVEKKSETEQKEVTAENKGAKPENTQNELKEVTAENKEANPENTQNEKKEVTAENKEAKPENTQNEKKEVTAENKEGKQEDTEPGPEQEEQQKEHDRDSDYTDVDDEEDLKLKIPEEDSTENGNLEENLKKLSLNKAENEKKQALEPTKKGKYYQHDTRNEENVKNAALNNEKWNHDKYDGKEKREKKAFNRRGPNKHYQKQRQNAEVDKKGVQFDEYMKQNEAEKFEPKTDQKPRPNQTKETKRDHVKPTPPDQLTNRLDFTTRIPTVLDDLPLNQTRKPIVLDDMHLNNSHHRGYNQAYRGYNQAHRGNNQTPRGYNQVHRGHNRPHGHNSDRKFDKPFEKNEKLDILITTNFQDSTRQISLSNHNNRTRQNDRRPAQNSQDNFAQYAPQFSGNQRRNYGNQSYDDNLHPYKEYMGYGDFSNGNENSDFSHIPTQTFSNRNFASYNQNQAAPRQNQRALTRGNHH